PGLAREGRTTTTTNYGTPAPGERPGSGVARHRVPVRMTVQPLERVPPLVQHAPVQILGNGLALAAGDVGVTPQVVGAVVLREQPPRGPQLGRREEGRDLRAQRRGDLVHQSPRVAAAGGGPQGPDPARRPEEGPFGPPGAPGTCAPAP